MLMRWAAWLPVVLVLLLGAEPAAAGTSAGCSVTDLQCQAGAGSSSGTPGSGGGTSGGGDGTQRVCMEVNEYFARRGADCNGCLWFDRFVRGPLRSSGQYDRDPPYPLPPTARWKFVICYPNGAGSWVAVPLDAPQPTVSATALALHARDSFRLPRPALGTAPSGAALVNLSIYLFVDKGQWVPSTATAAVPGTSVTVIATPRYVTWRMGDGGVVTCRGPGEPYRRGAPAPDCGYRYRTSTGSAAHTVTAAVTYEIAWTCTGVCDVSGGSLDPLNPEASTRLAVKQARAQLVQSGVHGISWPVRG